VTSIDRVSGALADRYSVMREIGRGGMATVYLAEDLRHHRKVAIKVLKDDVSASVGAPRFLREIEIAAQLQHPHILPLLDSGQVNGLLYYVMPFVEGQSLRTRLAREGELPIGDAVRIMMDVADALAYAHSRGVVHRDIKPDNIMLTGRHAVVADFGVARAVSQATDSSTLTSLGVALGTPAYMAPEQAVADPHIDQRADIYALGVVAYELLAGRTPFTSPSPQQMLAAQVTEKPDPPSRHRPGLSPALEQAVMRCLEKRAADRFQTADDLLAVLEPIATPSGGTAPTAARIPSVATPVRSSRKPLLVMAGAAALIVVAITAWQLTREASPTLELGRSTAVTSEPGLEIQPDISPDGRLVAYAAGNFVRMRIFIRPVVGGRTIPLSDDSTAIEVAPKWSPDGTQVLFLAHGGVSVAPALGGPSRPLVPGPRNSDEAPAFRARGPTVVSADWSPDGGRILFVRDDSLYVAGANGASPAFLATAPSLHSCSWSPSNKWIACVSQNLGVDMPVAVTFGNLAPSSIMVFPVGGGPGKTVTDITFSNLAPTWSSDGRRLFFISNRDGPRDLYAVGINSSGGARGEAERLTTGLGAISISLSGDGSRLVHAAYTASSNLYVVPIPAGAPVTAATATALTTGNQVIEAVSISPDGRWIVYDSNLGGRSHIWRIPIGGGQAQQLTNGPADEFVGDLSPDGKQLAYHSWRRGTRDIEVISIAGGEPEFVTNTDAQESYPQWSRDGHSLAFFEQGTFRLFVTSRSASGAWTTPRPIGQLEGLGRYNWSPDDSSIVMGDAATGRILRFAVSGSDSTVAYASPPGAPTVAAAQFGPDGRLYFKAFDQSGRASFWMLNKQGGAAKLLVRLDDLSKPSGRADFAVDGKHLYFPVDDRQSDIYMVEVTRKK